MEPMGQIVFSLRLLLLVAAAVLMVNMHDQEPLAVLAAAAADQLQVLVTAVQEQLGKGTTGVLQQIQGAVDILGVGVEVQEQLD
jgi:hypothetical protein